MVVDFHHFVPETMGHVVAFTEHRGVHEFFFTRIAIAWLLLAKLVSIHLLQGHLMVGRCVSLALLAEVSR